MNKSITLIAALFAAALLMGCANSPSAQVEGETQANAEIQGQQDAAQEQQQEEQQETGVEEESQQEEETEVTAEANIITKYLAAAQANPYKAEYEAITQASGYTSNTTMTMYLKHPNSRTDSSTTTSGMTIQARSFVNYVDMSLGIVSCTNYSSSWSCSKIKTDSNTQSQQSVSDLQSKSENYTLTADGQTTQAGISGDCFKYTFKNDPSMTGRVCYSTNGVMLYYKVTGKDYSTEMKLKSFSNAVTDADFVPPAEVKATSTTQGSATTESDSSGAQDYCDQIPDAYKDAAGC